MKCLYADTKGIGILQKPKKISYITSSTLSYFESDTGSIRESFFVNQVSAYYPVEYSPSGDFRVGNFIFEIGGQSKSQKQIPGEKNAYFVADNIEIGNKNKIPLWLFGFLFCAMHKIHRNGNWGHQNRIYDFKNRRLRGSGDRGIK